MPRRCRRILARTTLHVVALLAPVLVRAQTHGGFVATLGVDTVHAEQFTQVGNQLHGTVVMRTPALRIMHWSMTLDRAGKPVHYDVQAFDADGTPVLNGYTGAMDYLSDSVVRQGYRKNAADTARMAVAATPYPSPGIPYIGVSYLMYEHAFADARARAAGSGEGKVYLLTMIPGQSTPQALRTWFVAPDSAEMDYYGVARSGYKFGSNGALLRADWTGTTYRYRISRVSDIDIDGLIAKWSVAEKAGHGLGPASPRDSARGSAAGVDFTFDYSRPAQRGRVLWGDVVPYDHVWRLGADLATHVTLSADAVIGGTAVPAGRYTLWMLLTHDSTLLVISRAVDVWGTNYAPAKDFARIPMQRVATGDVAERLTLGVRDGMLQVRWGDVIWQVPVKAK
jgi:hypothetical protein